MGVRYLRVVLVPAVLYIAISLKGCTSDDDDGADIDSSSTPSPPTGSAYSDAADPPSGTFQFNVDCADGPDEVQFIHALMTLTVQRHPEVESKPKIMLGFSGGAAMASLMGCWDATPVWSAQVGVHYDSNAGSLSQGCSTASTACPEFMSVGSSDVFVSSLTPDGATGYLNQYTALRDTLGCPEEDASTETFTGAAATSGYNAYKGGTCYYYPGCPALGKMCTYTGLPHDVVSHMTSTAWTFLTSTDGRSGCTRAGTGDTPSFTASGTGTWHLHQTMEVGGRTRYYSVYVPMGTLTGVTFFLHGTGATSPGSEWETAELDRGQGQLAGFDISTNADLYGFIAVVPLGVPIAEASCESGSDDGGKR
jgi:poly(3-hydroxybutyrate) depolymerase